MWASKIHKYTFIVSIYVTSCQIVVQNYLALLAHILNGVNQNDPGVLKSEALIAATLLLWNLENEEKKLTNAWEFCSLINIMNIMKLDRQKDFYVVNRVYTHTHFFFLLLNDVFNDIFWTRRHIHKTLFWMLIIIS